MRSLVRLAPLAVSASILAGSAPAIAQTKPAHARTAKAAEPKPLDRKTLKALRAKLAGAPAEVVEALAAAESAGPPAAAIAPEIEAILRRGSTAEIVEGALRALGAMGAPTSSAAVAPYVRHRVPALRRAAARALARLPGGATGQALREGLRSSDGQVRGFSAAGLGAIGAREALPDLFLALDHDVPEAAVAIGQLCEPEECKRFVDRLGKIGLDVMTSGIEPILFRKSALHEDFLLGVVTSLRDLGTPEARRYLADVAARWPAAGSKRVKQALESAAASIPEKLGGKP
ncbi:MAG: hypothetical protein QM820_49930 [Minicystis sp.]